MTFRGESGAEWGDWGEERGTVGGRFRLKEIIDMALLGHLRNASTWCDIRTDQGHTGRIILVAMCTGHETTVYKERIEQSSNLYGVASVFSQTAYGKTHTARHMIKLWKRDKTNNPTAGNKKRKNRK